MKILHQKLVAKNSHYKKWHEHKYHSHVHWLSLGLVFILSLSIISGAWSQAIKDQDGVVADLLNVSIVRAQSGSVVPSLPVPSNGKYEISTKYDVGIPVPANLDGDDLLDWVVLAYPDRRDGNGNRNGNLMLEARDYAGNLLWEHDTKRAISSTTDRNARHEAFIVWNMREETPEDEVFFATWQFNKTTSKNEANMLLLDGRDGTVLVKKAFPQKSNDGRRYVAIMYWNDKPYIVVAQSVTQNGRVTAFDKNLNIVWQWDSPYTSGGHHGLNTFDLDGDGNDEVLYGTTTLDSDGTELWSLSRGGSLGYNWGHVDTVNPGEHVPGNGMTEVYYAAEEGDAVAMIDQNGKEIWYWSDPVSHPGSVTGRAYDYDPSNSGSECVVNYDDCDDYPSSPVCECSDPNNSKTCRSVKDLVLRCSDGSTLRQPISTNERRGRYAEWTGDDIYDVLSNRNPKGQSPRFIGMDLGGGQDHGAEEILKAYYPNDAPSKKIEVFFNTSAQSYPSRWANRHYRQDARRIMTGYTARNDTFIVQGPDDNLGGGGPPNPACSNKIDDDGDGDIDFPQDLGCTSALDNTENSEGNAGDGGNNPLPADCGLGILGKGGPGTPDITNDGCVDFSDLSILLSCWGTTVDNAPATCFSQEIQPPPPPSGDKFDPPYPRIGQLYLYEPGRGDEIWSGHDLIMIRHKYGTKAGQIRAKNPDAIILAANDKLVVRKNRFTPDWFIKCPAGSGCKDGLMNSYHEDFGQLNHTPANSRVNVASELPNWLVQNTDYSAFDGTMFDYWANDIWGRVSNLSLDGDNTPDMQQGRDESWIQSQWDQGNTNLISSFRSISDPSVSGKPIIAHEAGSTYLNGNAFEFWTKKDAGTRNNFMNKALELLQGAVEPRFNFANSEARINDFATWRADFMSAQIVGAFSGHDEGTTAHRYTYLHDEYEADLGMATSEPQDIGNGVWVRYYDKGVIIANVSGSSKTVSSSQLTDGPYYRFKGAQDPGMNNGQQFTSVSFAPFDGIMLFSQPTTLITPIVIDNARKNMTSIDQQPVQYGSGWEAVRVPVLLDVEKVDSKGYGLGIFWGEGKQGDLNNEDNLYNKTSGSGSAFYEVAIKVPGRYRVEEWHPDSQADGQGTACSNVNLNIRHASGIANKIINQAQNSGKWNDLGTYQFNGDAEMDMKAPGGCTTTSDAIRLVWVGSSLVERTKLPEPRPVFLANDTANSIISFSVVPTNSFKISWDVQDPDGLERVEIWRTPDCDGLPCSDQWQELTSLRKIYSGNVTSDSDSAIHDPPDGQGWYGLHVVDKKGMVATEKSSAFVPVLTSQKASGQASLPESRLKSVEGIFSAVHIDDFDNDTAKWRYNIHTNSGEIVELNNVSGAKPELAGVKARVGGVLQQSSTAFSSITNGNLAITGDRVASASATGTQRVAVLLVNYPDDLSQPFTKAQVRDLYFDAQDSVNKFYQENSYGQTSLSGDVFGWYQLDSVSYPCSPDEEAIKAADGDVDFSQFDRVVFIHPWVEDCGGGHASLGKYPIKTNDGEVNLAFSYINGTLNKYVNTHEQGHNYGVFHANSWSCPTPGVYQGGNCSGRAYGNSYDVMGTGGQTHMNALFKHALGWLSDSQVPMVTQSGTYTLAQLEIDTQEIQGLRIKKSSAETYYVEYRQPIGFDQNLSLTPGLLVNFGQNDAQIPNSFLVYANQSPEQFWLAPGDTFSDPDSGVTIGPIVSADDSGVTFDVNFSAPQCNRYQPAIIDFGPPRATQSIYENFTPVFDIQFDLINSDSAACNDSSDYQIKIGAGVPLNWKYTFSEPVTQTPGIFSLVAGSRTAVRILVEIPQDTQLGEYIIPIEVINTSRNETYFAGQTIVDVIKPIQLSLDANTPPDRNVFVGAQDEEFAKILMTGGSRDELIDLIFIASDSPNAGTNFLNFKLYVDNILVGQRSRLVTYGTWSNVLINLTNPFLLPAGGSKILTIVSDIDSSASGSGRLGVAAINARYYVKGINNNIYGNTMTFVPPIGNQPPNRPTNISQPIGLEGITTTNTTPSFDFTISDPNQGQTIGYQIQISSDPNFSNLVEDYIWSGSSINPNTVAFAVLADNALANGDYWWRVRGIDDQGGKSAWTEFGQPASQNLPDFTVSVPPPEDLPDLVSIFPTAAPTSANAGQSVDFNVRTANAGNKANRPFVDRLYIDGTAVAERSLYVLPGFGKSDTKTFSWIATCGVHTVEFRVDDDNSVTESDESNNTSPVPAHTINVDCPPPPKSGPPAISQFNVNSSANNPFFTIAWQVSDDIALDLVKVLRSPFDDNTLGNNPSNDERLCYDKDKSGCLWEIVHSQTLPLGVPLQGPWLGQYDDTPPAGRWWYGLQAYDSEDNVSYEPNPPGPWSAANLPDYMIDDFIFDSATLNFPNSIEVTILNKSDFPATQRSAAGIFDNSAVVCQIDVPPLSAQSSFTFSCDWTPTITGLHDMQTSADVGNGIIESAENNNNADQAFSL